MTSMMMRFMLGGLGRLTASKPTEKEQIETHTERLLKKAAGADVDLGTDISDYSDEQLRALLRRRRA
jgi:hypothetical protein